MVTQQNIPARHHASPGEITAMMFVGGFVGLIGSLLIIGFFADSNLGDSISEKIPGNAGIFNLLWVGTVIGAFLGIWNAITLRQNRTGTTALHTPLLGGTGPLAIQLNNPVAQSPTAA